MSEATHPRQPSPLPLHAPQPNRSLSILIPQPLEIAGGKAAPGVIHPGQDLETLHLVGLLEERPQIAVEQVVLAIQLGEQLLAGGEALKGR